MKFKSTQVKGKGRGRLLGFPTINLQIPKDLELLDGIYAVKVFIGDKVFIGALHSGSVPTFKEFKKTLEVFLIDTKEEEIPYAKSFNIEIIKHLRPVLNFPDQKRLTEQMTKDVEEAKSIVKL